jgi:hypothetical protein
MRTSFRNTMIAGSAIIALGAFAASAATPAPGDASGTTIQASATAATDHDMSGKVEQRITDLHETLKITNAQQPQWDAFVAIMRDNAATMDKAFQTRVNGMPSMNAVDNMQSYAEVSMDHAQGMQKMVPAFRALYAVLNADQRKSADTEFVDNAHRGIDKPKG